MNKEVSKPRSSTTVTLPLLPMPYAEKARRLLEAGEVTAVIGYTAGRRKGSARPVIVTDAARADSLVFSPACVNNLALYLTKAKKEVSKKGRHGHRCQGVRPEGAGGTDGGVPVEAGGPATSSALPAPASTGSGVAPGNRLSAATIARKCRECTVHLPEGADFTGRQPARALEPLTALEAQELAKTRSPDPGGAVGVLEGAVLPLHQVHGLPPGLPVLLLRAVPVRPEPPPGGGDDAPPGGEHGVAHRPGHAPGGAVRRLRRVRAVLPDGHSTQSPQPEDGPGTEGTLRPRGGACPAKKRVRWPSIRKTTTSHS